MGSLDPRQGEKPGERSRHVPPGRICPDGKGCLGTGKQAKKIIQLYQLLNLMHKLAWPLPIGRGARMRAAGLVEEELWVSSVQ